jgi:hypothetical protein
VQFSADGQWFWDGTEWRPAYSPDRAWRWDGRQWVAAGLPPVQRWRYEPTEWTPRLQVILLALLALGLVAAAFVVPPLMSSVLQQSIDNALAQQPADSNIDPEQFRTFMTNFFYGALAFVGVLALAMLAVVVAGIIKLWRWVYWYLVVTYLLAVLSLPSNLVYALGAGPIRLPGWYLGYAIPAAVVQTALAVWMIVLYRRYGTWARRRVPA